ncbi:hypothetical protein B0T24DRAFT_311954 [Lasiosphaeria ovina]|uniref:Uncharacterized protein n=1 Tax=Lasiosphaeria ovina TaxID=92902 RepID=A0AAE0N5B2_9PEZI|nr:hypothetical protein B0T24DRAFT_311954 [Lasiosphaeria ovina]
MEGDLESDNEKRRLGTFPAHTRAQTAGLPSPALEDQGKRPHGNQLRKNGRPSTIKKSPRQYQPTPVQSGGRKLKHSVDAPKPSPDPAQKPQREQRNAWETILSSLDSFSRKREGIYATLVEVGGEKLAREIIPGLEGIVPPTLTAMKQFLSRFDKSYIRPTLLGRT